jgi:hypothetical protein
LTFAGLTWSDVAHATASPLLYAIPLLAVAFLFGREMLIGYRGTRSVTLAATTAVLTLAGLAVIGARLLSVTR